MKILYGVVGEGMGHATRSHCIIDHLIKNHELKVVASARAYNYLKRFYSDILEIQGFELKFENNMLDRKSSIAHMAKYLPKKSAKNFLEFTKTSMEFSPDVALSDFDSFAYWYGKFHDIPIISIDNMQIINRCNIELPAKLLKDFLLAKAVVMGKLPGCYHYLITSFFFPEILKENTSLFPPILREEILDATAPQKNHILVYQSSTSNENLLKILKGIDAQFIVYGYNQNKQVGNIVLKKYSENGFIKDLASARGVIANSGFSLIGEALYLKKPYFAIPLQGQFEQTMNGIYLERLGYGEYHMELSSKKINKFIKNIDTYRENLQNFKHDRNKKIYRKLDSLFVEISKK
ncbi:MAG: hypothetical protein JSV49_08405 [Thermoplasmata archaeon]|nr:MAG: hypothetical protein JSV49_08405 [Thermoplasmata archaeon]